MDLHLLVITVIIIVTHSSRITTSHYFDTIIYATDTPKPKCLLNVDFIMSLALNSEKHQEKRP